MPGHPPPPPRRLPDGACGRVCNAGTGTAREGTHRRPSPILWILHGLTRGPPMAPMAREVGGDRRWRWALWHWLQEYTRRWLDRSPRGDACGRSRRAGPERRSNRHPARRPGGPAAVAGSQAGLRDVRHRPATGGRGGRAGVGRLPEEGPHDSQRPRVGRGHRRSVPGGDGGHHRRGKGEQPCGGPARPGPSAKTQTRAREKLRDRTGPYRCSAPK